MLINTINILKVGNHVMSHKKSLDIVKNVLVNVVQGLPTFC